MLEPDRADRLRPRPRNRVAGTGRCQSSSILTRADSRVSTRYGIYAPVIHRFVDRPTESLYDRTMAKTITDNQILGELGETAIKKIALEMRFIYDPRGRLEAGTDGIM